MFPNLGMDFSKLEDMAVACIRTGKSVSIIEVPRITGKSKISNIILDDYYGLNLNQSDLEQDLNEAIDTLWYRGKIWEEHYVYLKNNPRTKDVYKSKSTSHRYPWYHRNRKY